MDLGIVQGDEARREVEASRSALEERLGQPVDLFAYPYGRSEQLTEENRAMVRELGFRCAPSCYGGRVSPGDDPFRLWRTLTLVPKRTRARFRAVEDGLSE